jgi:hypothetical protein
MERAIRWFLWVSTALLFLFVGLTFLFSAMGLPIEGQLVRSGVQRLTICDNNRGHIWDKIPDAKAGLWQSVKRGDDCTVWYHVRAEE